jgi:glycosyltransferase involved in cell wall biosynthesis
MSASNGTYALITSAYNEEKYIQTTMNAVVSQTILPSKWVIISDGSTDGTDEIVTAYSKKHEFIQFVRLDRDKSSCNFASKVYAIKYGYELVKDMPFLCIGNLDADVFLESHYFEGVLHEFQTNPILGIGGGVILDRKQVNLKIRPNDDFRHVSGAIQLFRRECYEAIGGYIPIPAGGEDTVAVVMARMKGWHVEVFPDLQVFHLKDSPATRGVLKESFRDGAKDYALGSHPVFQIIKSSTKIKQKPYLLSAVTRMVGFFWQYLRARERAVDNDFINYLRKEQSQKLNKMLHNKIRYLFNMRSMQ